MFCDIKGTAGGRRMMMRRQTLLKAALAAVLAWTIILSVPAHEAGAEDYKRDVIHYEVPDVVLLSQRGEKVPLREYFDGDKPILLNFIYATCTTICPVLAAGFVNFQRKMGPDAARAQLVSVSIDPEHDSPEVMHDYLVRYGAGESWDFLTGTREDIDKVMRAFDSYVSNKMNHMPLTFLKAPGSDEWIRLDGLMGTSELIGEYRKLKPE
jgi:protein SCO1/2